MAATVSLKGTASERVSSYTQTLDLGSLTIPSGGVAFFALGMRTASGTAGSGANAPTMTVPSGVTAALEKEDLLWGSRGLYVYKLTGSGTGSCYATRNNSETWDYYDSMLVHVADASETLAQATVSTNVNGVAAISVSYGSTTGAATVDMAFHCRVVATGTTTVQSGWTDDDTDGPTQMRTTTAESALECHWEEGSNTAASTTWSTTSGQGHTIAMEITLTGGAAGVEIFRRRIEGY